MKLQTKMISLITGIFLIILLIYITFWKIDSDRTRRLIISKHTEKRELLNRSIALLEKSIELFAYDYSYWDEMLEFTRNKDPQWAYVNLETVMPNFNAQAVWVFNEKGNMIYSFQNMKDSSLQSFPVDAEAYRHLQRRKYFSNFFVWTPPGLVEIFGAPVQPSSDVNRITEPQGAFFVGRLWSPQFIKQLEDINNSRIDISRGPADSAGYDLSVIRSSFTAKGWDSAAVAYVNSEFLSGTITEIHRLSRFQFFLLIGFGMIIMIPLILFLRQWVISPLHRLMNALNTARPKPLRLNPGTASEFSQLSQLINNFFQQKENLERVILSRQMAEQALIQSENDYRNIFDNAHDAMVVMASDNLEILVVNAGACALYLQSRNELIHHPCERIWPDRDSIRRLISELDRNPVCAGFEAQHISVTGQPIQVEINACRIHYQNRPAILCINRDVTERKTLQTLQLSHTILKRVRNIVLVSNEQGKIIYANHSVKDILGYEPAEVLGEGWWNLTRTNDETRAAEREHIRKAALGLAPVNNEPYERWLKDRWGKLRCIVWVDALTAGNLIVGVGYDITERLIAQQALQESEQRYRFLFDNIPMALMMFSKTTGAILTANQAASVLFGYSSNQLLSMNLSDLLPSVDFIPEHHPEILNKPLILPHRKKDGSLIHVELSVYDVGASGKPFSLLIGADISLKIKSENTDIQLKSQKSQLAGIIEALEEERRRMAAEIHDSLGQLLSVVKRNLETIRHDPLVNPETGNALATTAQIIDSALAEAKNIAYDLLPRTLQDFGLWTAVENLIQQLFRNTAVKVGFHVHDIPERLPYSMELSLYRIVQEALNNILKHAAATEVSVQFVGYPNNIILTIEDNGRGFDVAGKLSPGQPGSGIGLKNIQDRVAYLDGNIYIDSTPDKGTSIIIETPKPQVNHE